MFLNNEWVTNEIKEESKRYRDTNENESTLIQNLLDPTKEVVREKLKAIQAYFKKGKISDNLTLYLKQLEKEQTKPKVSRRKEIIKT